MWLARYSWQNQRANNAVTYVSVLDGQVVGYYALAVASVTSDVAPEWVSKGVPRQVPCLLLARLAVDRNQGFGLGRGLLADALRRTAGLAESVGMAVSSGRSNRAGCGSAAQCAGPSLTGQGRLRRRTR